MEKFDVIFVCHGNVNRSKMAEFYFKKIHPNLKVDSFAAGVKSRAGVLITKKTRTILDENEIQFDRTTRSKLLTPEIVRNSKRVFIMDSNNKEHYIRKYGSEGVEKLELLPEVIDLARIKDPGFSKGMAKYYEVFEQIKESCDRICL